MVAVNLGPEFTLFADLGLESSNSRVIDFRVARRRLCCSLDRGQCDGPRWTRGGGRGLQCRRLSARELCAERIRADTG